MVDIKINLPNGFLNEEERCGYLVTSQMKEVWAIELDLLAEFDRICKKHNIQYMACGGTILGAVRHAGFIPWDDDIDLMMTRSEYNKLCAVAPEEFSYPYFFQTEYADPGSLRAHAQLRRTDTTAILLPEKDKKYQFNQGIFIDVFPLDRLPDDEKEKADFLKTVSKKHKRIAQICRCAYRYSQASRKCSPIYKKMVKDIMCPFLKMLKIEQKSYKRFETLLSKYNGCKDTEYIGVVCIPKLGSRFHYCVSDLASVKYVPFENEIIPIPTGYESVLEKQYGDWRQFVVEKSVHGDTFFDTNNSYLKYIQ